MEAHLIKRYLESLRKLMDRHDYEVLPDWNQYRQAFEGGFRAVILSASAYPEGIYLEAHLGIRFDAVEELVFPLLQSSPGFKPNSMTLVTPLTYLFGQNPTREFAENPADLERVLSRIKDQLDRKGFSFLRQCSSLTALDELFNENPMDSLSLVHNQNHRCFRGLALAHLAQRKESDKLAAIYRSRLFRQGATDQLREKFEQLVGFLATYSPN